MDGREELLARIRARVARCSWDEFLDLAEAYGFSLHVGKGSRRRLSHKSGLAVSVHEPHPRSKPVHPEAVKALLRAIERLEDET